MTNQEAFDAVVLHLLTQAQRSANVDGSCQYRGPGKLKCAIGALVPDEVYTPLMEDKTVEHLFRVARGNVALEDDPDTVQEVRRAIEPLRGVDRELLARLQAVHDSHDPEEWPDMLQTVAERFSLKW